MVGWLAHGVPFGEWLAHRVPFGEWLEGWYCEVGAFSATPDEIEAAPTTGLMEQD